MADDVDDSTATTPPDDPPGGAGWRTRVRPLLRAVALDAVLPLASFLLVLAIVGGSMVRHPGQVVSPQFNRIAPQDYQGTVWFYYWVHQALVRDQPILEPDIVCAPGGQSLGSNFPNWADAFLAAPLFHALDFPTSFNLFILLIPVLNALAAYWALRALTRRRALAIAAAIAFGFNAFTFEEIGFGRVSTALVFAIPLFVGAWLRCLSGRGRALVGWVLAAGAAGAFTVYYHPFFSIGAALIGALLFVGALIKPFPRVPRWRPLAVGPAVLLVCLFLAAPYVYQATFLQPRVPGGVETSLAERYPARMLPPWSPTLWSYIGTLVKRELAPEPAPRHRGGPRAPQAPSTEVDPAAAHAARVEVQKHALPLAHPLWGGYPAVRTPAKVLGAVSLLAVLALALLAGWKGVTWVAVGLVFYLLGLGCWACWRITPMEAVEVGDQALSLPGYYLYGDVGGWLHFIKPRRFFPCLLLAFSAAMVVGGDVFTVRARRWLSRRFPSRWFRYAVPAAVLLLLAGPRLLTLTRPLHCYQEVEAWAPSPFLAELAAQPESTAIIELPLGIGHAASALQLVHGKRRADSHHDSLAPPIDIGQPPPECYDVPLVLSLWEFGCTRAGEAAIEPPGANGEEVPTAHPPPAEDLPREQIAEAHAAGFRYVIVYPEAYSWLERRTAEGVSCDIDGVQQRLTQALGAPVYEDDGLVAWALTDG